MLIVLDSTSRTLRAKMSNTPSSVQCSVTVTYADTTATTFVEGMYPIQLNGTTLVTILPAPASGTKRVVKSVMFFNDDTMTHTITLYMTDNITDYPITKISLPSGASWASDDQTGVNVGGAVTDGSKGDISVANGGDTWTIANSAVTLAKMANLTSSKLIGRESSGSGVPQEIGVTGGIEFTGTSIQVGAFSGDVAKTAGSASLTISNNAVTLAKMADLPTDRLIGRDTAGTGVPEQISVGGGVEFTGSGSIQVGAFSGEVGKTAGSSTLTITDSAVVTARLADGAVTPAKLSTTAQALSFRNFLINGDMGIRQRETSVTGIGSSGYYTVDRWNTLIAGTVGTWTQTSENDGPSGQGFPRSLKMTCTTSNASLGSTDQLVIQQRLEGQNVQGILKGTANAQQVTVSFWVKSGTTGTYIAELQDNDNSRCASKTYTINSANTWERKTLTFPADTSGVLDNDNGYSLSINFWLVAGSDFTSGSLQSGWQTTTANRAASSPAQVNLSAGQVAGTNYWQITGVQLELGVTATEFERLPITTATLLCQRYFFKLTQDNAGQFTWAFGAISSADALYLILYPVAMRATPTVTMTGKVTLFDGSATTITETSANLSAYVGASRGRVQFPKGLLTAGRATWFDAVDVSPTNTIATTFAFAIEL